MLSFFVIVSHSISGHEGLRQGPGCVEDELVFSVDLKVLGMAWTTRGRRAGMQAQITAERTSISDQITTLRLSPAMHISLRSFVMMGEGFTCCVGHIAKSFHEFQAHNTRHQRTVFQLAKARK
jgi:hypothetical protein